MVASAIAWNGLSRPKGRCVRRAGVPVALVDGRKAGRPSLHWRAGAIPLRYFKDIRDYRTRYDRRTRKLRLLWWAWLLSRRQFRRRLRVRFVRQVGLLGSGMPDWYPFRCHRLRDFFVGVERFRPRSWYPMPLPCGHGYLLRMSYGLRLPS